MEKTKVKFRLVELPPQKVTTDFFEERVNRGRLLIFRGYHRRIFNLVMLGRWAEAEEMSRRLAGIFGYWEEQKKQHLNSCLKSDARVAMEKIKS